MTNRLSDTILHIKLACAIQAAIVAARQEGSDNIADALSSLLADLQPEFSLAA